MPNHLRWSIPAFLMIAWTNPAPGQSSYSTFTGSASNAGASHSINFHSGFSTGFGGYGGSSFSQGVVGQGGGGGGANQINYNPGIGFGFGPSGFFAYAPSLIVVGPGGVPPGVPNLQQPQSVPQNFPGFAQGQGRGGLMLPMPPRAFIENPGARPRRPTNPARAKEQVEIGDRSFRGGNIKRAEDRFLQAVKADPTSPVPQIHLAQVALVRGDYESAAARLRLAVTGSEDPGWLLHAPDIQSMFGEPGEFARHMARLESHLQAHPGDRDAWFVLGAESFLSGRSRQASDVFQRLTDRKPDEALAAFLDAATPPRPVEN
ncbi:tetratricopeptide repeat protein [Tundrisphaera lichenicola]|uniref:tetratricopeptide repeat protein n=1 Tax=Tundrisphaera lichenicola TaxID=2029860 RepID=UPI003EB6FBB3